MSSIKEKPIIGNIKNANIQNNVPEKLKSSLIAFINVGKKGLNRFDAYNVYGDGCLNSTISDLRLGYGIIAIREWEVLPNQHKTRCMRYWLSDDDMPKAKKLVNHWRVIRGEKPLYEVAENA